MALWSSSTTAASLNGAVGLEGQPAGVTVTEEEQCGTQAFASAAEQITGDFGDGLDRPRRSGARVPARPSTRSSRTKLKNFLDGENGDDRLLETLP